MTWDSRPMQRGGGEFVRKDQVPVLIQTLHTMIRGYLHVRPGRRVVDELNHGDPFLTLTEARIFDANGEVLQGTHFITVNRAHVVWIKPDT